MDSKNPGCVQALQKYGLQPMRYLQSILYEIPALPAAEVRPESTPPDNTPALETSPNEDTTRAAKSSSSSSCSDSTTSDSSSSSTRSRSWVPSDHSSRASGEETDHHEEREAGDLRSLATTTPVKSVRIDILEIDLEDGDRMSITESTQTMKSPSSNPPFTDPSAGEYTPSHKMVDDTPGPSEPISTHVSGQLDPTSQRTFTGGHRFNFHSGEVPGGPQRERSCGDNPSSSRDHGDSNHNQSHPLL